MMWGRGVCVMESVLVYAVLVGMSAELVCATAGEWSEDAEDLGKFLTFLFKLNRLLQYGRIYTGIRYLFPIYLTFF